MKISERSISALAKVITGDGGISPYKTGSGLVKFFNEFGFNDVYGSGFPSRWVYAEEKIRSLNGTPVLVRVIKATLDPRAFYETRFQIESVIDYLNSYLEFDGYKITWDGKRCIINDLQGTKVNFQSPFDEPGATNHQFINEQVEKCERKILEGDYDGAITNARSLIEAVLLEIDRDINPNPMEYDGDLIKLYRRVQNLLGLDPGKKDISDTLKQLLGGLASLVSGIAGLRNKMGDAHPVTFKPAKYHAVLAVNASKALAGFILEVYFTRKKTTGKSSA